MSLSSVAIAGDWTCHSPVWGACAYGFGPLCQPHYACPNPQPNPQPDMCVLMSDPPTPVCSAGPASGVCDAGTSGTGAVPDGVLCCATDADCPPPPSYGQPAVACGSMACNNGYCVARGPQNPGNGDASGQPCCRSNNESHWLRQV